MVRNRERRAGSVMLEFALAGVPTIFVIISLVWICLGMWQYQTLEEAVTAVVRSSSAHGAGCAGQTCATTVSQTAYAIEAKSIGIPDSLLNVTLTSAASTVTCNPLNSCYNNSSNWPTLSGNSAGTDISITAQFTMSLPISMWVPKDRTEQLSAMTVKAQAKQVVVY
jgi:hypothetical protein